MPDAGGAIEDKMLRDGRRRLRQLLPAARAKARENGGLHNPNALAEATLSGRDERSLDAVLIYPAPLGGWHADIKFRDKAPGVPDVIGTPVQAPCRTKAEAHEVAFTILVGLLASFERRHFPPGAPPAFHLDGLAVQLSPRIFEELAKYAGTGGLDGYGSNAAAIERVREVVEALLPGGITVEAVNALPREDSYRLLSVLHMATLNGLYRYPPMLDATPSGHRETSQARH